MLRNLLSLSLYGAGVTSNNPEKPRTGIHAYPYDHSHLSPLLRYEPESAWNLTLRSAYTNVSHAKVSVDFLGQTLIMNGVQEGANFTATPEIPKYRPYAGVENYVLNEGPNEHGLTFEMMGGDIDLTARSFSLELERAGGYIDTSMVQNWPPLPVIYDEDNARDVHRETALDKDGALNMFYSDPTDMWTVTHPGTNDTTIGFIPSIWYYEEFDPPFPSPLILSTNYTYAPLRLDVPEKVQLIQWYGTVGPDQGEFELRLIPKGDVTDFEVDQRSYKGSANRPVRAIEQLLAVAFLDPRVPYEAEVVLLEEGKNVDIHGLFFVSYVADPSQLTSPWYQNYNKERLRNWRIRGSNDSVWMVVRAVLACVAMLGFGMWFFSEKRSSPSGTTPSATATTAATQTGDEESQPILADADTAAEDDREAGQATV